MRILLSLSLLPLIMSDPLSAQTASTALQYVVRQPTVAHTKPPLLILLHGVGSNELDLFSFADRIPGAYLVISARAPNTIGPGSYAWYHVDFATGKPVFDQEQAEQSRLQLIAFIEQLGRTHAFDPARVYLCGFSQGAIMAYSVALTRPDLVHGIAAMSGRLLDEVKPLVKPSPALKQLSVFISHGTQDGTLPVRYAHEADAYLRSIGINPTLKTYNDGHTINAAMLEDLVDRLK